MNAWPPYRRRVSARRGALLAAAALLLPGCGPAGRDAEFAALCADRAAVERVYQARRAGAQPPFEQALPPEAIARLVRQDLRKETVLKAVYGVVVTPGMVADEVRRIDATTRAPDLLAAIKAALGNDAGRFAHAYARPLVVDALLRARFDNDDALHAPQRRQAEAARAAALAAQGGGATAPAAALAQAGPVVACEWSLAPRRGGDPGSSLPTATATATQVRASAGPYTIEATAQLTSPVAGAGAAPVAATRRFADLEPELQRVLAAQLRQAGDVSAVIELPGGFTVYAATSVSPQTLAAVALHVPKRNYDAWLAEQKEP